MKINKMYLSEIINHCEKGYPKESCGILAGKEDFVEKVYQMKNSSDRPRICYFMKPEEQIKVMKEIRNLNLKLLSIYHSHIDVPAYPSSKDVELAFYPDAVYIILSIKDGKLSNVKAYEIKENKINEVSIQ